MKRSSIKILAVLPTLGSLFVSLVGCGTQGIPGGGAPAPAPIPAPGPAGQQVKALTAFDRTGTLRSDGLYIGMLMNNFVFVGDDGPSNLGQRGIVSVVLNQVPPGATVTKAVLQIRRFLSEGDPFGEFGGMTVDHVNVVSSINAGSFLGSTLTSTIAVINPPAGVNAGAMIELDVTEQVKADLAAGRPISSFRFQFNNGPSLDGNFDQAVFYADQNDDTLRPTATITIAP